MMSYENDQRRVCVRKSKYKAKMNRKHTELKWDLSSLDKRKKIKIRNKVQTVKGNRTHWKQQQILVTKVKKIGRETVLSRKIQESEL